MKNFRKSDIEIEKNRHNDHAHKLKILDKNFLDQNTPSFISEVYQRYYKALEEIKDNSLVLELGAGIGTHSRILGRKKCELIALDISLTSLELNQSLSVANSKFVCGDISNIPFSSEKFDYVISCNSLSYGQPDIVDYEVSRVLRKGGTFIILDSLNMNPIYRINRYIKYLRGQRSKSTLKAIPSCSRIKSHIKLFDSFEVSYFGSFYWLTAPLSKFLPTSYSKSLDRLINENKFNSFAFKFVLILKGKVSR